MLIRGLVYVLSLLIHTNLLSLAVGVMPIEYLT